MSKFGIVIAAASLVFAGAASASAKPPLRDVREIDDKVYYALVAYEIGEQCDSISARKLKGINDLWALGRRAKALGYTEAEIKAYIRSDAEKARMRARGEAYMEYKGVSYDDPETFCVLGRAEIERNSAIGVYLRAN
ncbi:DUF5333 domain-containing protein [Shimia sp.]|uniref:DUF5333 domain-containing protein n=1 Tax=Shimia sp. TaxID=1954381 RepID=UPI003299F089